METGQKHRLSLVEKNATLTKLVQKILQDLARECINIDKLLQDLARHVWILQKFCKSGVFFAKFLQELYSVCTNLFHNVFVIALKESDTYVSKFRVLLFKNVEGMLQSIQNQAFRVCSENDRNDLIRKEEKK